MTTAGSATVAADRPAGRRGNNPDPSAWGRRLQPAFIGCRTFQGAGANACDIGYVSVDPGGAFSLQLGLPLACPIKDAYYHYFLTAQHPEQKAEGMHPLQLASERGLLSLSGPLDPSILAVGGWVCRSGRQTPTFRNNVDSLGHRRPEVAQ